MAPTATLETEPPVAEGDFRLDERQAREKLRNYRLPSPNHYILEFVKVANLLGASGFWATVDRREVLVRFDGDTFEGAELEELYSAAFNSQNDRHTRALRHLAVGVNAAEGMGLKQIRVEVGGEAPVAVSIDDGRVRYTDMQMPLPKGTRIRLIKRYDRGMIGRFIQQWRDRLPEQRLLYERARYSRVDVVVNGNNISHGLTLPDRVRAVRHYDIDSEQGVVGVSFGGYGYVTRVVQHGVLIEDISRPSPFEPMGAHAIVDSGRLTTDLSHNSVVENEAWEALRHRVNSMLYRCVAELFAELSDEKILDYHAALCTLISRLLADDVRADIDEGALREFLDVVSELPLFEPAVGGPDQSGAISISEATRWDGGKQVIWMATRQFPAMAATEAYRSALYVHSSHPLFELWVEAASGEFFGIVGRFLGFFADKTFDVTDGIERRQTFAVNRRRWQSRGVFELGASPDLRCSVGDCVVEAGRRDDGEGDMTRFFFVRDRRLLGRSSFETDVGSFFLVIRGNIPADATFSGPDFEAEEFRGGLVEAVGMLADLIEEGPFDLRVFCALLGDLQEQINRALHWQWSDWPSRLVDTPLGVALALRERERSPGGKHEVRQRLDCLGRLADEPILEQCDGGRVSLSEVFTLAYEQPESPRVLRHSDGFTIEQRRGGADGRCRIRLPQFARRLVWQFFFDVPGDESTRVSLSEGRRVSGDGDLDSDTEQLESTLARQQRKTSRRSRAKRRVSKARRKRRSRTIRGDDSPGGESNAARESKTPVPEPDTSRDGPEDTGPDVKPRDPKPDTPGDTSSLKQRLIADLRRHAPDTVEARVDAIDNIDIIDRCGTVPVHVLGDGNHLVFDTAHPGVASAADNPDDPVARGFAASAAFSELLAFDVEHGRKRWSRPKILTVQRQFLASMSSALTADGDAG